VFLVTPKAKEKLKEALQEQRANPEETFRISPFLSLSNLFWLSLDNEKVGDQVVKSEEGGKILLVRSDLLLGLGEMVLDYQETPQVSGFTMSKLTFH